MSSVTWKIVQLERNSKAPNKDGVIVAHWDCTDIETVGTGDDAVDHYGKMYGSISWTPDSTKEGYIKWSDLTEEDCIRWIHESEQVDKDAIEASVAAQIADSKEPAILTGKPWSE
tara:strand:- start:6663 stop:7007 length:345 start_codon:yes stop_codon:yes gene_type:complete